MSFNGVYYCPIYPDSCTYTLTSGSGYIGFAQSCSSCTTSATSYGVAKLSNGCDGDLTVKKASSNVEHPVPACGSIIYTGNQVVGESVPITGSSFNLYYFSKEGLQINKVPGYFSGSRCVDIKVKS